MASEKANKIKAIIKGTAPKSTFGTDPRDPWSTKSNINESGDLERYLRSRGINPKFVSTDSKISHSKSGEFAKWKRDHQFEEVQNEQTATEKHTPTEIKAHELQKKTHKHNEIGAVKSEAWDQPDYNQSIKARQDEADKKAKEQSKQGVNKLLNKYYSRNKKEHHVEEVEQIDELKKSTLASYTQKASADMSNREFAAGQRSGRGEGSVVTDPDIKKSRKRYVGIIKATHKLAKEERLNDFQKTKEDLNIDILENEEMWASRVIDEGKMGDLAGEIGRHLDKHIDDYKAHGGAEHLGYKTIDTAKKIVKSHNLHPTHAQKFVNDYVEKRLAEDLTNPNAKPDKVDRKKEPNARSERYYKNKEEKKKQGVAEDLGTMAGAAALGSAAAYGIGHLAGKMIDRFHKKYDGSARTSKKPLDKKYKDQLTKEDIWSGVTKAYPETKPKDAEKEKQIRVNKDAAILDAIRAKEAKEKKLKGEETYVCPVCGCTPCNCTHISEDKFGVKTPSLEQIAKKHNVSMEELKKAHEEGIKVEVEHTKDKELASEIARDHLNEKPDYYKKLKKYVEDVFQDPQAATQTVFDGATNTEDTTQNRKREMSKSARMIKALYKKHKMVKEDMYDHEKEDKSVATYGKKPKLNTTDKESSFGENKPDAAAILSGGTTLTGEPRDTIEIDPMMKNRPTAPEGDEVKDKKKSKQ